MKQLSEHQQLIEALAKIAVEQQTTNELLKQLVGTIAGTAETPAPTTAEATPEPEPAKDVDLSDTPEAEWAEPNCTKDQLQSYALSRVRQDKAFKQVLMGVLAEFGVKAISKLKDDQAPEVYAKLEQMK